MYKNKKLKTAFEKSYQILKIMKSILSIKFDRKTLKKETCTKQQQEVFQEIIKYPIYIMLSRSQEIVKTMKNIRSLWR